MFLGEINIELLDWVKLIVLPKVSVPHSICWRPLMEQKGWVRGYFSYPTALSRNFEFFPCLQAWIETSVLPRSWSCWLSDWTIPLVSLVLRPSYLDINWAYWLPWVSGLPSADFETCNLYDCMSQFLKDICLLKHIFWERQTFIRVLAYAVKEADKERASVIVQPESQQVQDPGKASVSVWR